MLKQTILPLKWLKSVWKMLGTFLVIVLVFHFAIAANDWHEVAPGIDYLDVSNVSLSPWSHIHAFRISLRKNRFSLVTARDLQEEYASVDEYGEFSKALIAINGGFFGNDFQPLGLRIRDKKQLSPFKQISWWGVFYIKGGHAYLAPARQFSRSNAIDFAIQSGPRLLVNGRIPPLKAGRDERTALGITQDGRIIIIVTEHNALSTTELAQLMKAPPLNCLNALNLDGGNSSQLYAKLNSFTVNVHGFSNVSDAVIVTAK